ncbi:unnamed protein product [Darwinula stevensoni]|uniref:Uncharacterized protein n=1 Tax=Darwinula stevensoni TaxID=69355 RepID=A0A7R8ZXJ1_9CRUS|nr:unnamed protein product [Darwinula stevensoni]CAG0879465.1 unnamed protein product [Darwinula stevensoni]
MRGGSTGGGYGASFGGSNPFGGTYGGNFGGGFGATGGGAGNGAGGGGPSGGSTGGGYGGSFGGSTPWGGSYGGNFGGGFGATAGGAGNGLGGLGGGSTGGGYGGSFGGSNPWGGSYGGNFGGLTTWNLTLNYLLRFEIGDEDLAGVTVVVALKYRELTCFGARRSVFGRAMELIIECMCNTSFRKDFFEAMHTTGDTIEYEYALVPPVLGRPRQKKNPKQARNATFAITLSRDSSAIL